MELCLLHVAVVVLDMLRAAVLELALRCTAVVELPVLWRTLLVCSLRMQAWRCATLLLLLLQVLLLFLRLLLPLVIVESLLTPEPLQFPGAATVLLRVEPNDLVLVLGRPHLEPKLVLCGSLVVSGVEPVDPVVLGLSLHDGEAVVRVDQDRVLRAQEVPIVVPGDGGLGVPRHHHRE